MEVVRLLLCSVVLALAAANDVIELTDANFESGMADYGIALVKFYAPWCGHCKKLAPEFDRASSILAADDPPVALVKVDCTAETKVCGKYGVSGYPTLKIFRNGEQTEDYNGPRDADGIVKYMRSKAGPSSKPLTTEAEVQAFMNKDEHVILGFFDSEDSELNKQFKKLADSLNEDFRFAHSVDKDVNAKVGYSEDIVIVRPKKMANKFEESNVKYDGDSALHKIKTWVHDNVHGLAGHRTPSNQDQFKTPLVVAYYDVDYVKNAKGTNYWRNRVMKVAQKFNDKNVFFAVSDATEFSYELTEYGLKPSSDGKPVVAAKDAAHQKFVMSQEFSMETFESFVNDFLDGKLEAYLKSEPVPASQDEPVKVVVAKNFEDIVNDESKDVLIEFYAPWCGHCKSLAPKYDELATKLADESDIVIAKMDATANDVPKPYEVRGFPTIFFAPKGGKKNPKKYEGGREVDDFIKYIAKSSTDPLQGYNRNGKKKSKTEL
jgi:protein disulfide isomerase family A protein 3